LILPLPQNVIDYLLDDGTLVVSGSSDNSNQPSQNNNNSGSEDEDDVQVGDISLEIVSEVVAHESRLSGL
ncbi:uncharacterized, partial [Tachysurus ichikawai]